MTVRFGTILNHSPPSRAFSFKNLVRPTTAPNLIWNLKKKNAITFEHLFKNIISTLILFLIYIKKKQSYNLITDFISKKKDYIISVVYFAKIIKPYLLFFLCKKMQMFTFLYTEIHIIFLYTKLFKCSRLRPIDEYLNLWSN